MSIDPAAYARLREIADQLPYIPGMGKVEIANGQILVATSPVNRHELAVVRIAREVRLRRHHPITVGPWSIDTSVLRTYA
ncbi:hypothetical protein [Kitasatospora sp. MAP5-34]|uniref:hypothetical protein n=1 Tax=Kitasatospora sp. MAP5-34 TaxID=3035102 RepID=UPI0024770512|nr:hypothetical protein [Kitasatospora sp. MAP5-34]MDH6580120.1 hypothetical protein [Kitasatospora sp. MAP5-34]